MPDIGDEEEGEAPGLLQSFGHMLGQTGVGPVDLSPGVAPGHVAVRGLKPAGLMQSASGASMPRGIAAPAPEPVPPKITAYHGTPHDFDQFDINKIGTGEGAQVYGHGLYFAENPKVATDYQKQLGQPEVVDTSGKRVPLDTPEARFAAKMLHDNGGDYTEAWHAMGPYVEGARVNGDPALIQQRAASAKLLGDWELSGYQPAKGHLYQVEINADPSHFLDWDKPLSEQSPKVQAAVQQHPAFDAINAAEGYGPPPADKPLWNVGHLSGQDFVKGLERRADSPWDKGPGVSQSLQDAGIPGIRYLDQGSRNAAGWHITPPDQTVSGKWMVKSSDYNSKGMHFDNEGDAKAALAEKIAGQTRNYVLFNDKLVNITHKNGVKVTPVERDPFKEEYSSGGVVQFSDYSGKLTPVDFDPFAEGIAA